MKKALTFLAVSSLALAFPEDLALDNELRAGHGGGHHGGGHKVAHHRATGHHGPTGRHGPTGHHGPTGGKTGGKTGGFLSHFKNKKPGSNGKKQHIQPNKMDAHKTHGLDKNKHTKPEKKNPNDKTNRNPSKPDNKPNKNQSGQDSSGSGSGSGNGLSLPDLSPLVNLVGKVGEAIIDGLTHRRGNRGKDKAPTKLEDDAYSVEELETLYEFIKKNPSNLDGSFESAWKKWYDADHPATTSKPNGDSYSIYELKSFFDFMKKNKKSVPQDFTKAWEEWDESSHQAHDNHLVNLGNLLKDGAKLLGHKNQTKTDTKDHVKVVKDLRHKGHTNSTHHGKDLVRNNKHFYGF